MTHFHSHPTFVTYLQCVNTFPSEIGSLSLWVGVKDGELRHVKKGCPGPGLGGPESCRAMPNHMYLCDIGMARCSRIWLPWEQTCRYPRAHAQSGRLDARQAMGQLVQGFGCRVGSNFQLDTLDQSSQSVRCIPSTAGLPGTA